MTKTRSIVAAVTLSLIAALAVVAASSAARGAPATVPCASTTSHVRGTGTGPTTLCPRTTTTTEGSTTTSTSTTTTTEPGRPVDLGVPPVVANPRFTG